MEAFLSLEHHIQGRVQPERFCQFCSWVDDPACDGMAVLCSLEVMPDTQQQPLFTTRTVQGGAFLRVVHAQGVDPINDAYRYIYNRCLQQGDITIAGDWEYQVYRGDDIEIYIPLV